jgi:hypothetical protein
MTTQDRSVRPPRFATWVVLLLASAEKESIEGDLFEEFSDVVSRSGTTVARRWYWRQALRCTPYLFSSAFRTAPYLTAAAVIIGSLLGRLLFPLPEKAIFAVLETYRVFDRHFDVYVFFATDGVAVTHVLMSMFVGCLTAFTAKRTGMIAAITVVFVLFGMTCAASFVWIARGNTPMLLALLPWTFLDWLAMLGGAAIVRRQRSASCGLRSST